MYRHCPWDRLRTVDTLHDVYFASSEFNPMKMHFENIFLNGQFNSALNKNSVGQWDVDSPSSNGNGFQKSQTTSEPLLYSVNIISNLGGP